MKDLLLIIAVSVGLAWFLLVPFPDFLSRQVKVAPVELIPAPINYNVPCDDLEQIV